MSRDGMDELLTHHAENVAITPDEAVEAAAAFAALPRRRGAFRRLLRRPGPTAALAFLVLLGLAALFAPWIAPYDPNAIDVPDRFATPSWHHLLGADDLGRDLLSRLLYGARVSLVVSLSVIVIATLVALVVGMVAGYSGGAIDNVLMRFADGGLSFPPLVLALAVAGILGPGVVNVIAALTIVFVFGLTRLVRGTTLAVREEPFVEASRAAGSRTRRILAHRVLPNIRSPLVIAATFGIAGVLLAETGLSFLGLGPRPPNASWGNMLRGAYERGLYRAPWVLFVPGVAIALTIFAFNLLGDGLRDVLGVGRSGRAKRTERRGLTSVVRSTVPDARPGGDDALLRIEGLSVEFATERGVSRVVDGVSLAIRPGETVGLVGESGSGKTVTSLAVMRLVPSPPGTIVEGAIRFDGQDLLALDFEAVRRVRGSGISMVFQDPMTSLDLSFTVGSRLVEAQRVHRDVSRSAARRRAVELLELVGIPAPETRLRQYPHQLSGGLRQRVAIAIALANEPRLLIADEPTTALDVTVQAQILDLLKQLQQDLGMAVLFVTHDLGVIADLCDRVAVMYAGEIVEEASAQDLFERPQHPYTAGLLGAMPQVGGSGDRLAVIPGQVPQAHAMPDGCRFADRCDHAVAHCRSTSVPVTVVASSSVRCVRASELELRGAR
ncbi:MAG: dipeptide/oligopeptide/nickel ABC transporter permease/ATP-binding protein [Actinomycetes bacterium]